MNINKASIEDFNSLNKKLNAMADVIDHISEIDQEIELLKRNQRPKIQVTKKDITSPLMSVMHEMEIDRGKISFPGSRSKEREGRNYDSGEPINVTRKVVEEEKVGYDNDYSRTSDLQGSRVIFNLLIFNKNR